MTDKYAYIWRMEQILRTHLLMLADAYASSRELSDATLGNLAAGDWRFFARLRVGKAFTVRKYDAVVAWFRAHWPDSAGWPEPVPK